MIRRVLLAFAFAWAFLTLFALLAYVGVMNPIGFYTHVIPATFILEQLGPVGEVLLSDRPFVGSGHGPPHLGLVGLAVLYVVPLIAFVLLAGRGHKRGLLRSS